MVYIIVNVVVYYNFWSVSKASGKQRHAQIHFFILEKRMQYIIMVPFNLKEFNFPQMKNNNIL